MTSSWCKWLHSTVGYFIAQASDDHRSKSAEVLDFIISWNLHQSRHNAFVKWSQLIIDLCGVTQNIQQPWEAISMTHIYKWIEDRWRWIIGWMGANKEMAEKGFLGHLWDKSHSWIQSNHNMVKSCQVSLVGW